MTDSKIVWICQINNLQLSRPSRNVVLPRGEELVALCTFHQVTLRLLFFNFYSPPSVERDIDG